MCCAGTNKHLAAPASRGDAAGRQVEVIGMDCARAARRTDPHSIAAPAGLAATESATAGAPWWEAPAAGVRAGGAGLEEVLQDQLDLARRVDDARDRAEVLALDVAIRRPEVRVVQ